MKLNSTHKIKFYELKESLEDLSTDIEMHEDSNVRGQILVLLCENTNYSDLMDRYEIGSRGDQNLVMQTELTQKKQKTK